MNSKKVLKILSSFPVICLFLYYIPFLGICLMGLRLFLYTKQEKNKSAIFLIILGLLILLPKILYIVLNWIKFNTNSVPFLNTIINSEVYNRSIMLFSKRLIIAGILYFIVISVSEYITNNVTNKISTEFRNYIEKSEKADYEIAQKNDLLMKEKREKAKNTHVVKCPSCGSDNMLTEKTGTCKFCRKTLEYKE